MSHRQVTVTNRDGGQFSAYLALPEAGSGPGIVLLQEIFGVNPAMKEIADYYAAEGYVVIVPDLYWRLEPGLALDYIGADQQKAFGLYTKFNLNAGIRDIEDTVVMLRALSECTGKVGVMGFCLGGRLAFLAAARIEIDCAVAFYGVNLEAHLGDAAKIACPLLMHFGDTDQYVPLKTIEAIQAATADNPNVTVHVYPGAGHAFARPNNDHFNPRAAGLAHSRAIALLRRVMGPDYDLGALWDRHTMYEFGQRDVAATMGTMVAEPYVNHVPTMTGGVGYQDLARFYKNHFVNSNPADTKLVPLSRTIGADRVVDEMLFCFTHDREIDWMLPGVKPTGKYVEIPLVAIVNFHGDKLYHEHIYWDQASVLVQIGLLDPKLLPVAGIETAKKVVDKTLPSNTLMKRWAESAGKA